MISRLKDPRRSYVEVLQLKRKVLNHMLAKWLLTVDTTDQVRASIKDVFKSFQSVRTRYACYPTSAASADLSWQTGWPQHASSMTQLIDDMVYTSAFDSRYKE